MLERPNLGVAHRPVTQLPHREDVVRRDRHLARGGAHRDKRGAGDQPPDDVGRYAVAFAVSDTDPAAEWRDHRLFIHRLFIH